VIIDTHTHVWPDGLAQRALAGNALPDLHPAGDGTIAGLTCDMADSGVDLSCCLAIANRAAHVDRVNQFVNGVRTEKLFPVGTIHVGLPAEDNLASLQRNGITAVKIHPMFQDFALDDPRLWTILGALEDSHIAVITHVGEGGNTHQNRLSNPAMIRDIAQRFPDLSLVACHFGGFKQFDEAEEILTGVDVILETSWPPSLAALRPERVRDLIRRHGAERVAFGSDWPMARPKTELSMLDSLDLRDDELKLVLGGSIAQVLGQLGE
jgi:predicted TIM-barrel fold metal-dependent hydrolase